MANTALKPQAKAINAPTIDPAVIKKQLLRPLPAFRLGSVALTIITIVVIVWAATGVQPDWDQINRGKTPWAAIADFVGGLFPPKWEILSVSIGTNDKGVFEVRQDSAGQVDPKVNYQFQYPLVVKYIIETVQMALIGTLVGIFLSFPFGLLAARNTAPTPLIYYITRLFLNIIRSVPEIVWALVFVAAVGLGPFSGVMALAVAGIGSKGKLYAEAIEAIDPQQVMAVRATGAARLQVFAYGVVPQALPLVLSYSLLSFESNVRAASILGLVGAGGIGFLLTKYLALFQYQELMGTVILLVVAVTVIDRVSDYLRKKFI
jgi:phosphonate transport system permease protein